MKRTLRAIMTLTLVLILPGNGTAESPYGDRILRLRDSVTLGLGQILPGLGGTDLIFLGEKHDDPAHHDLQMRVIRAVSGIRPRTAIALEMFPARDQTALDGWVSGVISEEQFLPVYRENWGDTWHLYREIFLYARDRGIPMVGLNVPKEITSQVARQGFASLSREQLAQLPGVSCDVDDRYRRFIRTAMKAHGSDMDTQEFERFCEALLVWDTTMAWRLVSYLRESGRGSVLVIAGNSHAWKPGIPGQLSRFDDGLSYVVILPEVPRTQTRAGIGESVADFLWLME